MGWVRACNAQFLTEAHIDTQVHIYIYIHTYFFAYARLYVHSYHHTSAYTHFNIVAHTYCLQSVVCDLIVSKKLKIVKNFVFFLFHLNCCTCCCCLCNMFPSIICPNRFVSLLKFFISFSLSLSRSVGVCVYFSSISTCMRCQFALNVTIVLCDPYKTETITIIITCIHTYVWHFKQLRVQKQVDKEILKIF